MKNYSPLIFVYSVTLLLSASLLFFVQPMFSRMILPLLGGTPNVWTTAMLFFQVALLAGYAYAHGTSHYLPVRAQGILHLLLLGLFAVALPLGIPEGWSPPADQDPTAWQLTLMTVTVGGPFFILSASAPLLQRWFAESQHKDAGNPYFLYGASNLGSIGALLAYPVIFEPLMDLQAQSSMWFYGYWGLIAFIALSFIMVWRTAPATLKTEAKIIAPISWSDRLTWLILAFIPSSLMLGVTTYVTTDIGSMPMLWVIPLALYVGTFIIVFARKPMIGSETAAMLSGFAVMALLAFLISDFPVPPFMPIILAFAAFFVVALSCHLELANARPAAGHLTEFYLIMSLGGALGGFFNSIIATNFLVLPIEFALALTMAMACRFMNDDRQSLKHYLSSIRQAWQEQKFDCLAHPSVLALAFLIIVAGFGSQTGHDKTLWVVTTILFLLLGFFIRQRWNFTLACLILLFLFPPGFHWLSSKNEHLLYRDRNFFGITRVYDTNKGVRILLHGTTNHGEQALAPAMRLTPISYYNEESPISDTYKVLDQYGGPRHVAVIGLGAGVTACYQKQGRHFDFYEIDPAMKRIAEDPSLFTYLSDCGSPYDIILGDARLTIQNAGNTKYDLIQIDAFSSDNIPMHLLTREAVQIYIQKIKTDGMVMFHISNRYLDLEPVLAAIAGELELDALARLSDNTTIDGTDIKGSASHCVILTKNKDTLKKLQTMGWNKARTRDGISAWTDQFSNLMSVIGNKTGDDRFKENAQAKQKITAQKSKKIYIDATQP